jgi:hypothetical protein
MKIFGKKAPPAKESLAQLRNSVAMLEKREEFLQKKADQEVELGTSPLCTSRTAVLAVRFGRCVALFAGLRCEIASGPR